MTPQYGLSPTNATFVCLLHACAEKSDVLSGLLLHQDIDRLGMLMDIPLQNALFVMYTKCQFLNSALTLYNQLKQKGIAEDGTVSCLLTACMNLGVAEKYNPTRIRDTIKDIIQQRLQYGHASQALYKTMLHVCANMTMFEAGCLVHGGIQQHHTPITLELQSALLSFYSKCGHLNKAELIFQDMKQMYPALDPIAWNAMMAAYGNHGQGKQALRIFDEMQNSTSPNSATFVAILNACSHSNLYADAVTLFELMSTKFGVQSSVQHVNCMIDLFARCGDFAAAEVMVHNLKNPDKITWSILQGAARSHKNIAVAEKSFEKAVFLDPTAASSYVLLGNTYAQAGRYKEATAVRNKMVQQKIHKKPGISCIEIKGQTHCFTVGDRSHPQSVQIYAKLDKLNEKLKQAGFKPDTSWVLKNLPEVEKERVLCYHR